MTKTKVVIFTKNNARVFTNPPNLSLLSAHKNAFVNPDLSKVSKIPPHFWKVVNGEIIPMNPIEKRLRMLDHSMNGVHNNIEGKIINSLLNHPAITWIAMALIATSVVLAVRWA